MCEVSRQARKLPCRQVRKTSNVLKSLRIFIRISKYSVFDVNCSSTSSKSGRPLLQASARSDRSEIQQRKSLKNSLYGCDFKANSLSATITTFVKRIFSSSSYIVRLRIAKLIVIFRFRSWECKLWSPKNIVAFNQKRKNEPLPDTLAVNRSKF